MIRAKFRCLSIHRSLDQGSDARLLPVNPKSQHEEGSEENRKFWDATPTGEITLRYRHEVPLVLGAYYYVDLEEAPRDDLKTWKLWELVQHEESLGVRLSLRWLANRGPNQPHSAELQMSIQNLGAWETFLGKVGTEWAVNIHPAD